MKRHATGLAIFGLLAGASAQAAEYYILNYSTLNDVRRIGAANIPEVADYVGATPTYNPQDPTTWPILDRDITTFPYADPAQPLRAVGIEPNSINVYGTLSTTAGVVSGASIRQCDNTAGVGFQGFCSHIDPLSFGTYQSATVQNNVVSGDVSLLNVDPLSGTPVKSVLSNGLVWTYSGGTTLSHQSGGGTAATSASIATCVPVVATGVGTGISGQCRQLQAGIDASGELGGTTIVNSLWNWTGIAANYLVQDSQTVPWHTGTGTINLNVSGASGHAGITWDYSGFVEGVGGIITARVTSDALTGANAGAQSALYTLYVTTVPVPAAAWLLGSALGVLGWIRRRSRIVA